MNLNYSRTLKNLSTYIRGALKCNISKCMKRYTANPYGYLHKSVKKTKSVKKKFIIGNQTLILAFNLIWM